VSTEEQATGGVSLEAQEERLRAYCVGAGLNLATIVREEGVSGGKPIADRPAGSTLLQMLGARKARHVVALKLDRLFRSAVDALNQTKRWDDADVTLHLVDMGGSAINTRSAMGRLMLTMMAAFAELERNMIAERTTTAMRHMKAKRAAYSPVPLGFQRVGNDLHVDATEMATIKRIQDLRTLGWNYTRIADYLNAEGVPTKRGGRWWPGTIRYLLKNDLYQEAA
jgi:DNA invertase Pin-like site-specific DNA recombinase